MTLSKHKISSPSLLTTWFKHRKDLFLVWLLRVVAAIAGAIMVLILGFLIKEALPVLQEVGITAFF